MPRLLGILSFLFSCALFADSADLRLLTQSQQVPGRFLVTYALMNDGPDAAKGVVVTIDVPQGSTVSRATIGYGDLVVQCDTAQRPVRCELGDLHVGMPPTYGGFEIGTAPADASFTATISAGSATPDPNTANNVATLTWQTKIEADLGAYIRPSVDRLDPGQTGRFVSNVCNDVRENKVPDVRAEFTLSSGVFESWKPATGFACTSEGTTLVCTAPVPYGCPAEPFEFEVRTSSDRSGGEARLSVHLTSDVPEKNPADNEKSAAIPIYRWLTVNTTADGGVGSLRDAITQANAGCTPGPCRIVFEIPPPVPAEGWFTIIPATPLPDITAERVTLEGSRQTALTGDTNPKGPEVAIDGRLAGRGLKMLTGCEGVVEGLAIGNFLEDQGLWFGTGGYGSSRCSGRSDTRLVSRNHIGVDPTGTEAWPNLRGLRADFATGSVQGNVISNNIRSGVWLWTGWLWFQSNRIEDNGGSGMLIGPQAKAAIWSNLISRNGEMGVAIVHGAPSVELRGNAMKDNGGLGIDWNLDGAGRAAPVEAPVILSAHYDAASNTTQVVVSVEAASATQNGQIEVFANTSADGDGEQWIGSRYGKAGETTILSIAGNYRGKWLNATWTRVYDFDFGPWLTSELSNSVLAN